MARGIRSTRASSTITSSARPATASPPRTSATAQAMAAAISADPSLDLTVKTDAENWAARLHGELLPMGTVRAPLHGAVTTMPGFNEGEWWVQDAAAALPVKLFGDIGDRLLQRRQGVGTEISQAAQFATDFAVVEHEQPGPPPEPTLDGCTDDAVGVLVAELA